MLRNTSLFITSLFLVSIISCSPKLKAPAPVVQESVSIKSLSAAKEKFDADLIKNKVIMATFSEADKPIVAQAVELSQASYTKTYELAVSIHALEAKKSPTAEDKTKIEAANVQLAIAVKAVEEALTKTAKLTGDRNLKEVKTSGAQNVQTVKLFLKGITARATKVDVAVQAGSDILEGKAEPEAKTKK